MMKFFTVTDNSSANHSYPWVMSITQGLHYLPRCKNCRYQEVSLDEAIEVRLMDHKGSKWPDALGCGAFPLLIISDRFVEAWMKEGFGNLPLKRINMTGELPRKLRDLPSTRYFTLDGFKLRGAEIDAEASGYIRLGRCSICRHLIYDVSATRNMQEAQKSPLVFLRESWRNVHLFTTELTRANCFFCTEELVRMARTYKLTNVRFVPIEKWNMPGTEGIEYLNDGFVL